MVRSQMKDAVEKQQFARAEMLKRLSATIAGRQLYGFLASRNVLPKYGFPVDVVELNLARTGDAAALNLELQRDLKLAIGEYAPGARLIAGKAIWVSQGVVVRPNRELRKYQWIVCGDCGAARHQLIEVPEECTICGSQLLVSGRFVIGVRFRWQARGGRPVNRVPYAERRLRPILASYQKESPEFEAVDSFAPNVQRRYFRQGRITVINQGPGDAASASAKVVRVR